MKHFKAIAAMSENRVIGHGNKIPWHLPEDFQWFKKMTLGNITVMGRKTFESLGQPLANRKNLILTRHPRRLIKSHPEVFGAYKEWRGGSHLKSPYQFHFTKIDGNHEEDILIFNSLEMLNPAEFPIEIFICGGAQIYAQALPFCSDLFLTRVKRHVEGDAFFPAFEDRFELVEDVLDREEFSIRHYRNSALLRLGV
ncbi:MAG: dihydrofolate reductase [Verrucomicrobia bacterium]|nr:dihydrofolate reductase [Verrucomicrobiota bacterium]